ncbi:MAG: carboxypeptidase-like regulatory domain-containing protein, partial [Acidobacteriota bacterium]
MTSGPGSVTVDSINAGTGLQSLTVVGTPVNVVVTIPAFTPGTFNPVTVTFTPVNPALAVDFNLRAASSTQSVFIHVRCGTVTTAAPVSIGGRVMTMSGRGIANVRLTLTDANGQVRTARTTSFGYYHFDDVRAGETYILSAFG